MARRKTTRESTPQMSVQETVEFTADKAVAMLCPSPEVAADKDIDKEKYAQMSKRKARWFTLLSWVNTDVGLVTFCAAAGMSLIGLVLSRTHIFVNGATGAWLALSVGTAATLVAAITLLVAGARKSFTNHKLPYKKGVYNDYRYGAASDRSFAVKFNLEQLDSIQSPYGVSIAEWDEAYREVGGRATGGAGFNSDALCAAAEWENAVALRRQHAVLTVMTAIHRNIEGQWKIRAAWAESLLDRVGPRDQYSVQELCDIAYKNGVAFEASAAKLASMRDTILSDIEKFERLAEFNRSEDTHKKIRRMSQTTESFSEAQVRDYRIEALERQSRMISYEYKELIKLRDSKGVTD